MRIFYFLTWVTRFYAYIKKYINLYILKICGLNYMCVMNPLKIN